MATRENAPVENGHDVETLWRESAARANYAVHGGSPLIGVSGTTGDGHIIALPAPAWFAAIPTDGERDNVFRALAAHALRVGQAKLKASKTPTRDDANNGVNSVFDGSYKPSREVMNDVVDDEAKRLFADHIRTLVLSKNPAATQTVIDDTVTAYAEKDSGKALIDQFRAKVLESMTYTVSRKDGKTGGAVDLGDLSI